MEYNEWFESKVEEAIAEADSDEAVWIGHKDAKLLWKAKKEELLSKI